MNDIIKIEKLYKSFGEVKAVQDLSFKIKKGEFFAFLGVNGAGKSTTINIICAQLEKDSGSVLVDGVDIDKDVDNIKKQLGVVFQNSVLDSTLSVYDNLKNRAELYGTDESVVKSLRLGYEKFNDCYRLQVENTAKATELIDGMKSSLDCNIEFFGNDVSVLAMYLILIGSVALLLGAYVLLNKLKKKSK